MILVDNGSSDGTAEAVREQFPGIELIETGENQGYTGGNNPGIRRALDRGAEYVLILNNDTVVDPGFVRELLAVATRPERIGFVSPKIYFKDPPTYVTLGWDGGVITSRVPGMARLEPGAAAHVRLDGEHLLFFDRESGRLLDLGGRDG